MNVTLTLKADDQLVSAIQRLADALTSAAYVQASQPATPRVSAAPAQQALPAQPEAPTEEAPVQEEQQSATVHPLKPVTAEQVRAALNAKVKEKKSKQALALLGAYGATSVAELNQEQLADIFPKVKAL